MTNPTEQFRSAVESALESLTMHSVKAPDGTITIYHEGASPIEALASIQAATVELFTRLVGEDEPLKTRQGSYKEVVMVTGRSANDLRAELRQAIDQLIKDLSNE